MANQPGSDPDVIERRIFPTTPRLTEPIKVPRIELRVDVEGGKASGRKVTLEGDVLRMGSHPSNELVLDDRTVSRFHCRLTRGPRAWTLIDNGSLNGTKIGGVWVRDADLMMPECRIEMGDSVVVVREAGSKSLPPIQSSVSFGALYGASQAMRKMYDALQRVARTDATVLVEGESGTGKELITAEIVRRSPRAGKPFVVVDCGSIAPSVVESELFGHARGAFTGADRVRTNRQVEREVNQGRFREDLYFRLSVVTVRVPPLRERREDIPLLVEAFLSTLDATDKRHLFTPEVVEAMTRHDWPGNVRELRNFVERRVVFETADVGLDGDHPVSPSNRPPAPTVPPGPEDALGADIEKPFRLAKEEIIEGFERKYLAALLAWAEGNVSRAARKAKIDRMYLHRLLQHYGLRKSGSLTD